MSFYIDLTEFLGSLRRTGIERLAGELCTHLPPGAVIPVRFHNDHYVALPATLIPIIAAYFGDASEATAKEIRRLGAVESGSRIEVSPDDTVLVTEIFTEQRAAFFRGMPKRQFQRCRFIIHDLLPATHPEYFPPDLPLMVSGYLQIIRRATCCGFVSEDTRQAYHGRLKRSDDHDGVVLSLGSDSLGPRAQHPTFTRPLSFTVLGTIEPRKNHALILEAFEPLLREVKGLSLSFIGKVGWVDSHFIQKVQTLAADKDSGFRFHPTSGDDEIRNYIEQSRATIYVSAAEGYGLPPVESLWLGTPVIASRMIPSLNNRGAGGIHYVDPLNVMNLRRAILTFLDDAYANQKVEEAMRLNLPTWRSFTEQVLHWCAADAQSTS